MEAVYFLTPVTDDATPRSLQPFLQRTGALYATASGGGFSTSASTGPGERNFSYLQVSAGFNVYVGRYVELHGGGAYTYDVVHEEPMLNQASTFAGHAGVALRLGDLRLGASYAADARTDGEVVGWGSAALSLDVVLEKSVALSVDGYLSDVGSGGSVRLAGYFTRDVELFGGLSLGTSRYLDSDREFDYLTVSAGFSQWLTSSFRVALAYEFELDDGISSSASSVTDRRLEHGLSLNVLGRLR